MVVRLQKTDSHCFVEWFNRLFNNTVCFKRHYNTMHILKKLQVLLWRTFVSTLFATLLRNRKKCACGFIAKSAVIKNHQLLSKLKVLLNGKSCFDQLATVPPPLSLMVLIVFIIRFVIGLHCFCLKFNLKPFYDVMLRYDTDIVSLRWIGSQISIMTSPDNMPLK